MPILERQVSDAVKRLRFERGMVTSIVDMIAFCVERVGVWCARGGCLALFPTDEGALPPWKGRMCPYLFQLYPWVSARVVSIELVS